MTYTDFEKENNLRKGTKEYSCGCCIHGYTNGMLVCILQVWRRREDAR